MFKDRGLGCLPLSPPHDALWPGGLRRRPAAAEIAPNVFETVRVGGEVDIGIDNGEDIYQACQQGFVGCRQAGVLVHPLYERCLIASIGIDLKILIAADNSEELLVQLELIGWGIGPERVAFLCFAVLHQHANEVDELTVEIPLKVDIDAGRAEGQLWGAIDIDFLLTDRQRL
jgi:hypothetical protein